MSVKECFCGKLSPNKKSIFGLRMRSQIVYLLLFVSFLASPCAADSGISCTNVKSYFERKGILSAVDIQEQPNSDVGGLCLNQGCCGAGARPRLMQLAKTQFESALRSELSKLADVLSNRAKRFDDFFHKLLQLSREGFHNMFKRTYGMIYEQHSYVFEQLFEQLEKYYSKGEAGFEPMMDGFFGILYQKMFTVLNSQYTFDERYLKCVNDHMRDYQPFEDMPHKLSVQLRRAFVATRTFHKALRGGASVLRSMMQVSITPECVSSWARLRHCGECGAAPAPACSRYCHNVVRGCLPLHADLGEHWDAYVDAVEKVADRLLGPFNIAMVVEPLDIKISEAIMSFQDHNQEISQKIFTDCGKPVLGGGGSAGPFFSEHPRTKRDIDTVHDIDWKPEADINDFEIEASYDNLMKEDPALFALRTPQGIRKATQELEDRARTREEFLKYMKGMIRLEEYEGKARGRRDAEPEPEEFQPTRKGKKAKVAPKNDDGRGAEWGGPELTVLVREARQRVRSSKRYWSHLPAVMCSAISVTTAPCFNGTSVASYTLPAAGEGSTALASNPEVRGSLPSGRSPTDRIKMLTARLKDAYNGVEVPWKEEDDLQPEASERVADFSEGPSGSGDDTDEGDRLPDDDEDSEKDFEGSGSGVNPPPISESPVPAAAPPPPPPAVVPPPAPNNVDVRSRVALQPQDTDSYPPLPTTTNTPVEPASAAERPSLHRALLTYALPVVCAWFGTIVTDLF